MRFYFPNILFFIVFLFSLGIKHGYAQDFDCKPFVSALVQAKALREPIPNVSTLGHLTVSQAYNVQVLFVREQLKNDSIAGYKAGLTTQQAQDSVGIDRPIFGVLLKSGDLSDRRTVSLKPFHSLHLEIELGFITNRSIKHVIHSVEELKQYIDRIIPVIEMPDLGFESQTFNVIDLIAANAAFSNYIFDPSMDFIKGNINSLSVSLFHDGNIVIQGQGTDALGDQWEALRWLINQVISYGWNIEKGHLLITGTLGELLPARAGVYCAKFNNQATIQFSITDES